MSQKSCKKNDLKCHNIYAIIPFVVRVLISEVNLK